MVESLKRSIENLESPTCPNCRIDMKWYRSAKVAEVPSTIAHYFTCPNCHRITETRSRLKTADMPEPPLGKLSRPASRYSGAAA